MSARNTVSCCVCGAEQAEGLYDVVCMTIVCAHSAPVMS